MITVAAMDTTVRPQCAPDAVTLEELSLARALEECLDAMERGETDLVGLAARYPAARDEILPLLEIAWQLRQRRSAGALLSAEFKGELRGRLTASS